MTLRIVTTSGSFASLFSLVLAVRPPDQPLTVSHGILLGIGIALFVWTLISDIYAWRRSQPLALREDAQILDYLYKWISKGGRAVIFSRDLSWVNDAEMIEMLRSKARKDELAICTPAIIPLMQELRDAGAHIYDYPELDYVPESRFTIINKGRMDAQVAVGRRIKDRHVIEEFSVGHHPVFAVANDLVEIVRRFHEWKIGGTGRPEETQ